MNEQERLRAMWQARLRGDDAAFDRLYAEEMAARSHARQRPARRGAAKPIRDLGDLVAGADGVLRPKDTL